MMASHTAFASLNTTAAWRACEWTCHKKLNYMLKPLNPFLLQVVGQTVKGKRGQSWGQISLTPRSCNPGHVSESQQYHGPGEGYEGEASANCETNNVWIHKKFNHEFTMVRKLLWKSPILCSPMISVAPISVSAEPLDLFLKNTSQPTTPSAKSKLQSLAFIPDVFVYFLCYSWKTWSDKKIDKKSKSGIAGEIQKLMYRHNHKVNH